ncbi:MAG: ATP-binding protein [Coleofasciculaceae cyanobacterium]
MPTSTVVTVTFLERQLASLLIYQCVFCGQIGVSFVQLLQSLAQSDREGINCLMAYGKWFKAIAASGLSWQDYLLKRILLDDNSFTQQVQLTSLEDLPPGLITAAKQDLRKLQHIYQCSSEQLAAWVQESAQLSEMPAYWQQQKHFATPGLAEMREKLQQLDDWTEALADFAAYSQKYGTGLFAQYHALRWQSGELSGITHPDPIRLDELAGYQSQKDALIKNTEFLLAGYRALNVLLYGSRGSGKSSLVKALLQKYSQQGLRLIEVAKSNLKDLPVIVEQLRDVPQKFIIFVDDLSFEEDDDAFKALKVVLEGSLTARPQNVVVYATSNRRHLVREFFDERPRPSDSEEINTWDTLQEKLSFSDRFGLTLTFEPANQDTYLTIIRHLADQVGIDLAPKDLKFRALQWATRHNGRSGRTARQFVDFLKAELDLHN